MHCFVPAHLLAYFAFCIADGAVLAQPKSIQIGMAKTFLVDRPKGHVDIATKDFKEVLSKTTGLDGIINIKLDSFEIAQQLDKKHLDIGIFHAHEFAWVHKKHPALEPVLIAATKKHAQKALVIVHQNRGVNSSANLRAGKLDLPVGSGETCRIFIEKVCRETANETSAKFFSSIKKSASAIDALDEVARGKADATVVDMFALEFYKEVKGPVFAKNLRILVESEPFPPTILACRKDGMDAKTRSQLRDGLMKAHTFALGRDLMKTWNMDAFEPIPKDFDEKLNAVLKAYPAPFDK